MFVYRHKIILKTCGTTTLLIGLERLLQLASSVGFETAYQVFYSRKNFTFPDLQLHPHRSWEDEVGFLNRFFENGSSYVIGNEASRWHLYLTTPEVKAAMEEENAGTLEIIMTGLSPSAAQLFYLSTFPQKDLDIPCTSEGHQIGRLMAQTSNLSSILMNGVQDTLVDAFAFNPCGFSANSIIPVSNAPHFYSTIHITPEMHHSYASFETNMPTGGKTRDVLDVILSVFCPDKFSVNYFELNNGRQEPINLQIEGYSIVDKTIYDLKTYQLTFWSFERL